MSKFLRAGSARSSNPLIWVVLICIAMILLTCSKVLAEGNLLWGGETHDELVGGDTEEAAQLSAIAMDEDGRFIIAWNSPSDSGVGNLDHFIKVRTYQAVGTAIGGSVLLSGYQDGFDRDGPQSHAWPSIAITPFGQVLVVSSSDCQDCRPGVVGQRLISTQFSFDAIPSQSLRIDVPASSTSYGVVTHSAGIGNYIHRSGWSAAGADQHGLLIGPDDSSPLSVRGCDPLTPYSCRDEWEPAVAMRSDGIHVLAWAEAEWPNDQFSPFDIQLQVYASNGTATGGEFTVNAPVSVLPSNERSPAVAIDDGGNIVVAWVGEKPDGATGPETRIYARRYKLDMTNGVRDPVGSEGYAGMFLVDSDPSIMPRGLGDGSSPASGACPTVALIQNPHDSGNAGSFVVAWNANPVGSTTNVYAQCFDPVGEPIGMQFRVNQTSDTDYHRALSQSGAHTIAYGLYAQIVATWTRFDVGGFDLGDGLDVYYTLLLPDYAEEMAAQADCIRGDANDDGLVDGRDVDDFVDMLINGPSLGQFEVVWDKCRYDTNLDGLFNIYDVYCFVNALLGDPCYTTDTKGDCNENGIGDTHDIASGTSLDCNLNLIPDECDIADATSLDVNTNGVPDECEPDCNKNDIPDAWDISQSTSDDVNSNGIPDECEYDCNHNGVPDSWEISQGLADDCNTNGQLDVCESDCNSNGVPDDCDVDPTDPDGDNSVSPDCNGNGFPDECDLLLPPPVGSLDCNGNGIPDECDIASCNADPACDDCNENGYPDSCDIASGLSTDADENGVPDECEMLLMMMQSMSSPPVGFDEEAAWAEFYEWSMAQTWGPASQLSGAEQFELMLDKLEEIGLPTGRP